jgi:opacity protein-like surface antigen
MFTSFGQQRIRNTGYASLSGWEASGGVSERLSDHLNLTAQYVYMDDSGIYLGNRTDFAVQAVRVSLNWTPQAANWTPQTGR